MRNCGSVRQDVVVSGSGRDVADGRRAAVPSSPPSSSRHHLHQDLRRRSAVPHVRPDAAQLLRAVRRHHRGGRHHRPTDRQEPRIWIRKCLAGCMAR